MLGSHLLSSCFKKNHFRYFLFNRGKHFLRYFRVFFQHTISHRSITRVCVHSPPTTTSCCCGIQRFSVARQQDSRLSFRGGSCSRVCRTWTWSRCRKTPNRGRQSLFAVCVWKVKRRRRRRRRSDVALRKKKASDNSSCVAVVFKKKSEGFFVNRVLLPS